MLKTRLTKLLGIEVPVLLAPMALVSGGALARAVTEAGGLGFIGGGYCDPDWVGQAWQDAGNSRVGIGFITWALRQRPELLDQALARQPRAVWLSFDDEAPFAGKIKQAGVPLIAQIQTLEHARRAIGHGADILVAQGTEAGGHGARRATMPLVPAVVDIAGDIPVLAAGGIADGRGLAAALMLGASGVALGTRFYVAQEALSHPNGRQRLIEASGDQTVRTSVIDIARSLPWPAGFDIRVLRNDLMADWQGREAELRGNAEAREKIVSDYAQAVSRGDFDTAAVVAGEAADLIHAVEPAVDILRGIVAGAEACLKAPPGLL